MATNRPLKTFTGRTGAVFAMAFAPNGKTLATAGQDKTVRIWNPATGKTLLTINGHTDVVNAVAYPPDGKWLATASDDRTVRLWPLSRS